MEAYAKTLKGDVQEINGDAFVTESVGDYLILMVSDGVGGKRDMPNVGAIANSIVRDFLERAIENNPDITIGEIDKTLDSAFYAASRAFRILNSVDPRYESIFSSMACMVISAISHEMTFSTIGGCEIQLWKNGNFMRMNDLQTEAYEDMQKGKITESEYYNQPNRSLLTSAFGQVNKIKTSTMRGRVSDGDIYFLLTDGIFKYLTPNEMISAVAKADKVREGVDNVIKKIEDFENRDNATMICLFIN